MLAILAGAIAALGHAPFGGWFAALPAFALLIWVVASDLPLGRVTGRRAGWLAWLGGLGYFGVALHWIVEPFIVDAATHGWMAPFALILLAGGLALFWAAAAALATRLTSTQTARAFAFAVLLSGAELLRGHIFTGFPWALPAYIWADTPLLGMAAVTGSYGLAIATLVGAALPTMMRPRLIGTGAALVFFGVLVFVGQSQLSVGTGDSVDLGGVRLVQPNVPQAEKWQREKVPEHLGRLMSLTAEDVDGLEIKQVVWPEAAVVYPLDQAGAVLSQAARTAAAALGNDVEVILGINRRNASGDWFNSLVAIGKDGELADVYDKVHLVPFGEYIPFRIEFLRAMAATSGFGFTSGETVRLLETPLGRALPLICYEGIFPRHLFRARERADYILLVTNDAWFGTFSGPYQHFDQARFRAVEHRLPVVRVANTGVSAVIDRFGQVDPRQAIELGIAGHTDAHVVTSRRPTLYARTGDWPGIAFVLFVLGALILLKKRNTIAKPRPPS